MVRVRTEKRHTHDLAFSPYYPDRLACATGQFYGLAGMYVTMDTWACLVSQIILGR